MRNLPPAYFALVMATGIVSIAAHGLELPLLAEALFGVNLVAYSALWVVTLLRTALYPRRLFGDLVDHRIGPGYFTVVAGSCLLGAQFLVIENSEAVAAAFLVMSAVLWILLTYAVFTAFTIKRGKPSLEAGLTGAWLVAVVATQSIAVLSTLIARGQPEPTRTALDCFALSMWLWGVMFYAWLMTLIFIASFFARSSRTISILHPGSRWGRWRFRLLPARAWRRGRTAHPSWLGSLRSWRGLRCCAGRQERGGSLSCFAFPPGAFSSKRRRRTTIQASGPPSFRSACLQRSDPANGLGAQSSGPARPRSRGVRRGHDRLGARVRRHGVGLGGALRRRV